MRRWLVYGIAVLGVGLLRLFPFLPTDVAKLHPVEVLHLSEKDGKILLQTDTGQWGVGDTVALALEDMKKTALGTIFLDTADYLLIQAGCEHLLEEMAPRLRPGCYVCVQTGPVDLKQVASYLRTHIPNATLHGWAIQIDPLPQLRCEEGRMELVP